MNDSFKGMFIVLYGVPNVTWSLIIFKTEEMQTYALPPFDNQETSAITLTEQTFTHICFASA